MKRQTLAPATIWLLCLAMLTAFTPIQAQTPSHFEPHKPGSAIALVSPTTLPGKADQEINTQILLTTAGVTGNLRVFLKADKSLGELLSTEHLDFQQPLANQITLPLQLVLSTNPHGYLNLYTEEYFDNQPSLRRNFAIPFATGKKPQKIKPSGNTHTLPVEVKTKSIK